MHTTRFVLLAAVLAACSTKDAGTDTTRVSQAGPAVPHVVTVNARDFTFTTGDTIQSGMTTFRLINDGTTLHHVAIARLDSGKTIADLGAALKNPGPPPAWMVLIGGPNAPDPKSESNATLDVAPGNYALLCLIDIGGVPHFAKGMLKALTVVASTGAAAPAPIADDSITLADYAFSFTKPLSAGHHTFRVVNTAAQPHELEMIKLAPGKTGKDLLAWIMSPKGPPPGSAVGGITPGVRGVPLYFSADLTPGNYFVVCFAPDVKDGKPHVEHGMSLTQTVQ